MIRSKTDLIYYVQFEDLTSIIADEAVTDGFPFEADILRLLFHKNSESIDYAWDESYDGGAILARYTVIHKRDPELMKSVNPPRDIYVIQPDVTVGWQSINSEYITE